MILDTRSVGSAPVLDVLRTQGAPKTKNWTTDRRDTGSDEDAALIDRESGRGYDNVGVVTAKWEGL